MKLAFLLSMPYQIYDAWCSKNYIIGLSPFATIMYRLLLLPESRTESVTAILRKLWRQLREAWIFNVFNSGSLKCPNPLHEYAKLLQSALNDLVFVHWKMNVLVNGLNL